MQKFALLAGLAIVPDLLPQSHGLAKCRVLSARGDVAARRHCDQLPSSVVYQVFR
jgi:hypothetical protein